MTYLDDELYIVNFVDSAGRCRWSHVLSGLFINNVYNSLNIAAATWFNEKLYLTIE